MNKFIQKIDDWLIGWPDQGPISIEQPKKLGDPTDSWTQLLRLPGVPLMFQEAMKEYGVQEGVGSANNKKIINWAKEVYDCSPNVYSNWAADWYNKDSIPWCGLFQAIVACRSSGGRENRLPPKKYLSALAWADFAEAVDFRNLNNVWMGDVAVFVRSGGGHVATVVGISTDGKYIFCLGGNQANAVNVRMFPISRLYAIRRPRYNNRPQAAKHFRFNSNGNIVSDTEQ